MATKRKDKRPDPAHLNSAQAARLHHAMHRRSRPGGGAAARAVGALLIFALDAIGLDAGSIRGLKVGDQRPDLIILDDIDDEDDTPMSTAKKAIEDLSNA